MPQAKQMGSFIFGRMDLVCYYPAFGRFGFARAGLLASHLSGLRQGEILGDRADFGANGLLILSKALEHKDAAVDVDADVVALPVLFVDLFAGETEMTALIDVP
jgi:hypothetical protein